ncbi:MAG: DNA (cytosine-5-)-methyltransferase [Rickettsiales bacterium]|nr:MAG: DNA (cytosine-5-)-methyltransferase [Rickettsiales bacterium]
MNVLSLFDGISTLHLVLEKLNIKVNKYYSSEIERTSIEITQHNFPNTIQLGDITKWKEWDIEWEKIDLVAGGSPCQSFSTANAGNKKRQNIDMGFEGKSKLFFVYLDILNYIKSKNSNVKFLLENVKMKTEWKDKITSYLKVEPILIDSEVVSPQHRQRYYWCNWQIKPILKKKDILLKDIIIDCTSQYFLSEQHHKAFLKSYNWKHCELNGKGKTILATYYKQPPHTTYIPCKDSPSGFRRLTPLECEKMQTLPDNFTKYGIENGEKKLMSDTARYKAVGNGWTFEVIKHIFSNVF